MNKNVLSLDKQDDGLTWEYGIGNQSKKAKKLDKYWSKFGVIKINCHQKRCYKTKFEAQIASDFYNYRIVVMEFPMVPYWCSIHDTWHKGHDRKLSKSQIHEYLRESRNRAQSWMSGEDLIITF